MKSPECTNTLPPLWGPLAGTERRWGGRVGSWCVEIDGVARLSVKSDLLDGGLCRAPPVRHARARLEHMTWHLHVRQARPYAAPFGWT